VIDPLHVLARGWNDWDDIARLAERFAASEAMARA